MGREVSGYDVSAMICGGAVCGDGRIVLHLRSHMRVSRAHRHVANENAVFSENSWSETATRDAPRRART